MILTSVCRPPTSTRCAVLHHHRTPHLRVASGRPLPLMRRALRVPKVITTCSALRSPVGPPEGRALRVTRLSSPASCSEAPWPCVPCTGTHHQPSTPRADVQASVLVAPVVPRSACSGVGRWSCPSNSSLTRGWEPLAAAPPTSASAHGGRLMVASPSSSASARRFCRSTLRLGRTITASPHLMPMVGVRSSRMRLTMAGAPAATVRRGRRPLRRHRAAFQLHSMANASTVYPTPTPETTVRDRRGASVVVASTTSLGTATPPLNTDRQLDCRGHFSPASFLSPRLPHPRHSSRPCCRWVDAT